jgi:N-acetylglucosaminyldiphosphoundecaprenol N-acetyl-beta-D-mannosaminyltransferase
MQEIGLEWFHRLLQEPRKMLGRYTRTNAAYAVMLFRSLMTGSNPIGTVRADSPTSQSRPSGPE